VTRALVLIGIPVNGQNSTGGETALHYAVIYERRELVVALLAAGADPNVKDADGWTSVWLGATFSAADILQLLMDGGGSVKEPASNGETPLIGFVRWSNGDAAARLKVLLVCSDLDLDAEYEGKTAEEWAVDRGHLGFAVAIVEERRRRMRWSALRAFWIAAITSAPVTFL
jgi:ankyrin repeat protein